MKRSERARALAALFAVAAACGERRPAMPPQPRSIEPAVGYGSVPTSAVIHGEGFYVRGVQLASGGTHLDTRHRAWVGGLELADVTWVDVQTLRAVVPAGLTPGTYGLEVENALGDRGAVAGAYQVVAGSPAALRANVEAVAVANLGQVVSVTVTVTNDGDASALSVAPVLSIGGVGTLAPLATPPAADVPAGMARSFAWSFRASALGDVALAVEGGGLDAGTGASVALPPTGASLSIVRPAALAAQVLTAPAQGSLGQPFDVTLHVENTGDSDAANVTVSVTTSNATPGSASASLGTLPGGTSQDVTLSFTAAAAGAASGAATDTGTDGTDGSALTASASWTIDVPAPPPEAVQLASDPFGDGTDFAFATGYHGQLWLGPTASGAGAVAMNLDGSARQAVAFAFPKDVVGSGATSANSWAGAPPYPSIGALGCQTNTAACGPDNENGRGLFTSVTLAGAEWLVAIGAKPGGNLRYAYMTQDTASPLSFRYVDLSQLLSAETRTATAVAALGGRLYLGFPGKGGQSPFLLALTALPSAPGLDPVSGTYAITLDLSRMPYLGASGSPKNPATILLVDALAAFSDRLYVANNGGFARSTNAQPGSYTTAPSDWATCTPASLVKTAVTTTQQSDLEPADKAVPAMVAAGGRLFAIRNVYLSGTSGAVGGQLWRCAPTALDPADAQPQCATTDWSLIVPDDGSDGRAAATLLAPSATYLYLGFNRVGGARVYRTANLDPTSLSDFTGQGGCIAGSAGCQGLGGDGFGDSSNTRLLDARVVADAQGGTALYVSAGDPSAVPSVPVRVYRIPE